MSVIDRISRLLGRRGIEVRTALVTATVLGKTPSELYREQPALRAVVSFLADNAAHLPLKCYERVSDTDRPRDTTSALALFIANPSASMTEHELIRATASDYYLYGWALWCVVPSLVTRGGWSATPIPVSWIIDVSTFDGIEPSSYTVVNPDTSKQVTLQAEDCIRFFSYDPMGSTEPHSPVESLKQTLSEQISAWNFRNGVWKNGGRVSSYLYRPKDSPWGDGARDRFAQSWKAKFSGEGATDTGGTPLLEDGMELRTVQFNAREAEWAEATRLAREDVAAVYHIDQSLVWHGSSQTYASVKDSARSLYADTMGPFLDMMEERLNQFLVPKLGLDPARHYCEFDMQAKLQGSFEERASVMQSATGGPWLLRNEARAWMNLPAIEGGDDLIVPLNVVEGGLASPNDTDPTVERYGKDATVETKDAEVEVKDAQVAAKLEQWQQRALMKSATEPTEDDISDVRKVLERFTERQRTSVLNALKANPDADVYELFDQKRWDRELAEDLEPVMSRIARRQGAATLRDLGIEADLDEDAMTDGMLGTAKFRAYEINYSTLTKLAAAVNAMRSGEEGEGVRSTAEGVFDEAATSRAERMAGNVAASTRNAAAVRAVGRHAPNSGATKTWVTHSAKPRHSHVKMNGETVPYNAKFSNGARWPGDTALPPQESCNCRCSMEIRIGKDETPERRYRRRIDEAETVHSDFYSLSVEEVAAEREHYDSELRKKWNEYKERCKEDGVGPKIAYDTTVGLYFSGLSKPGHMSADSFVELKDRGHEAQLSKWFADSGYTVKLRTSPSTRDTNDALLDKISWEFKRITSDKPSKMKRRITEKIPRQGPRFVVDLSESRMAKEEAERAVAELLDDENIIEILLVQNGTLKRFKK